MNAYYEYILGSKYGWPNESSAILKTPLFPDIQKCTTHVAEFVALVLGEEKRCWYRKDKGFAQALKQYRAFLNDILNPEMSYSLGTRIKTPIFRS